MFDYAAIRRRTEALTAGLATEDFVVQVMTEASPTKWHLAHTTWFFEAFVLRPFAPDYQVFHPRYDFLFNSYYDTLGERTPRHARGLLSRPTVQEIFAYRAHVDAAMLALVEGDLEPEVQRRIVLGTMHEEQHQELLLTDLKAAFGFNPLRPSHPGARLPVAGRATPLTMQAFEGGLVEIGAAARPMATSRADFTFDNETPRHRVWIDPFELADRCVTCGEYLAFMEDRGYERHELWLADGWAWLATEGAPRAPLHWFRENDAWFEFTLAGSRPLDLHAPVTHVSFYEADAYARWAGCRLPTEAECEIAAAAHPASKGAFQEQGSWQPLPDSELPPATGLRAVRGNQWEWTSSPYQAYPGFEPLPGALGEYNGKFMCNQFVLRGGSCVTPEAHFRSSYRNFFYPSDRWQFTGVRLARSIP